MKSILLVTSAYHTRRALAILQARLPQYHFSAYAADDPFYFSNRWWTNRVWATTTLSEWERYLWWLLVDRWRSGLSPSNSVVAYCEHGHQVSQDVVAALRASGLDAAKLAGGIAAWRDASLPGKRWGVDHETFASTACGAAVGR